LLLFNEILSHGFDGQHFINGLASHFRDLLVCKDPSTLILLEVGANIRLNYQKQAEACPVDFLFAGIKLCNECDLAYRDSRNKRLLVELTLIRLAQLSDSKKKIAQLIEEEKATPILPFTNINQTTSFERKEQVPPVLPDDTRRINSTEPIPAATPSTSNQSPPATTGQSTDEGVLASLRSIRSLGSIRSRNGHVSDSSNASSADVQSESQPSADLTSQAKPYSIEQLMAAWSIFAATLSDDIHLANGLKTSPVNQLKDHLYEVVVSNQVLLKKMEELRPRLETYLQHTLQNSHIQLTVRLDENQSASQPYTSKEKLEAMMQKNPDLAVFCRTFGLDPD
jgi:DNA polymerase-3 subunit gamma/tau